MATIPECTSGNVLFLLCGIAFLLYGTVKAYQHRNMYQKLLAWGALADVGFICMALAVAQGVASTGAFVFALFQCVARALAFSAYAALGKSCIKLGLAPLQGNAASLAKVTKQNPLAAMLFALGMLAAVGGSPFLVPEGRFFMAQGMVAADFVGHIPALLLVALCTTIFVWLHLKAVRTVYLEHTSDSTCSKDSCIHIRHLGSMDAWAVLFAVLVAVLGLTRSPVSDYFAQMVGVSLEHATTHMVFVVLFAGAFVTALLGMKKVAYAEKSSVIVMALAVLCVLCTEDISAMGRVFALLITGMGLVVTVYSIGYMAHGHRLVSYYFFLLLTFAALVGIVTTAHAGAFHGYWELMTFASFFLVVHERTGFGAQAVLDAGHKYYLMCAGGAVFMLVGLVMLSGGEASLTAIATVTQNMPSFTLKVALMLTLVGFAVKAGLVPLQSWLPDAHPAAPSSVSGPLSGVITKLGIFGIITILLGYAGPAALVQSGQVQSDSPYISWIGYNLSFLGGITLIYGELMALRQDDIKRLLAYSTLGQIGEVVLVLGLGTFLSTVAALTHVINHAIMKDLLFLCAGALILRTGSRSLNDLRGLGSCMPFTVGCMAVGLIAIMGLPPFAGFIGKYLMIQAAINSGHWLMAVLILAGSLVGAVYYTRILRVLIFEKRPAHLSLQKADIREQGPMCIALGFLAALCVLLGVYPQLTQELVVAAAGQYFSVTAYAVITLESMYVSWPVYVLVPMLGAVAPYLLRQNRQEAGRVTVGILLLTALLVLLFGQDMDTLSFGFAVIVPLMGALNMLYALEYMEHSHTQWRFYAFFLAMCSGLIGLASAEYLFSFFLFWEIMSSWALYFTIAHEGTKDSLAEAFKYFIFNLAGAGCIFLGVCFLGAYTPLVAVTDTLTAQTLTTLSSSLGGFGMVGYGLLALGFVMKAAQLPFRIDWQMHPALAPTPVSGFISSVLLKSALLGLMKLFIIVGGGLTLLKVVMPESLQTVQSLVMWIGGITVVMAATQALMSSNLKLIFIYSTVSQIGYMVLAVAVGTSLGYAGGLLHVVNHVFFKDLLFLMCGVLMFQSHKDSLQELGGIGYKMPFTLTMFAIAGLSVVGIPPTSGFTSKWIIYHALMQENQPFLALLSLVGSVITLAYIAKFLHAAFMGQPGPHLDHIEDASPVMRIPMTILAAGCILLGIFPGLMLQPINMVLAEYGLQTLHVGLTGVHSGPAAWNATNMFVLMILALVGTWKALMYFVEKNYRITPVHTCGLSPQEATSRMLPSSVYGGIMTFWRESLLPTLYEAFGRTGKKEK